MPKVVEFLDIETLSDRLQREADEEYDERQRQRPAAEVAAEEERRERLRELVTSALETDAPKFAIGSMR